MEYLLVILLGPINLILSQISMCPDLTVLLSTVHRLESFYRLLQHTCDEIFYQEFLLHDKPQLPISKDSLHPQWHALLHPSLTATCYQ